MWFLAGAVAQEMKQARAAGFVLSAEQVVELTAASRDNGKMRVVGRDAVIPIEGALTERPDFFAAFFGGGNTTYPDIKQAIAEANRSPEIDSIVLAFGSSPGGTVTGMFSAMDAIRESEKPVTATVRGGVLSAAYSLASQAGHIVAADRGTQFGSVGVAVDLVVSKSEVSIASTEAPKKRPDPLTDEGKAVIREQLDPVHDLIVESIAAGRGTTEKKVNANFGRGAMVLAEQALQAGMIDAVGVEQSQTQSATAAQQEVGSMDLEKLKADHRAAYDAVVAIGRTEERDRVCAHLQAGEDSGDIKTASASIRDGSGMTMTLQATYMGAARNAATVADRGADNVELNLEAEAQGGDTLADRVAKEMDKLEGDKEGLLNG